MVKNKIKFRRGKFSFICAYSLYILSMFYAVQLHICYDPAATGDCIKDFSSQMYS